ncbi:MAG: hypothetical protein ACK4F7_05290 [Inhella sp.]
MKVVVDHKSRRLDFQLIPDELDARPPLDRVWFRFDRWVRTDPSRMALLAFSLVEDLIGNSFELEGLQMPAHVASALQRGFPGHELFVQGLSNEARALQIKPRYTKLLGPFDGPAGDDAQALRVTRTEMGFEFHDAAGELQGRWTSNLALHLSLCAADPPAALQTALYLMARDAFLVQAMARPAGRTLSLDVIKEVGGELH